LTEAIKLTTDRYKASCGLFATAELLVQSTYVCLWVPMVWGKAPGGGQVDADNFLV